MSKPRRALSALPPQLPQPGSPLEPAKPGAPPARELLQELEALLLVGPQPPPAASILRYLPAAEAAALDGRPALLQRCARALAAHVRAAPEPVPALLRITRDACCGPEARRALMAAAGVRRRDMLAYVQQRLRAGSGKTTAAAGGGGGGGGRAQPAWRQGQGRCAAVRARSAPAPTMPGALEPLSPVPAPKRAPAAPAARAQSQQQQQQPQQQQPAAPAEALFPTLAQQVQREQAAVQALRQAWPSQSLPPSPHTDSPAAGDKEKGQQGGQQAGASAQAQAQPWAASLDGVAFNWRLEGVEAATGTLESPPFELAGCKWRLVAHPQGRDGRGRNLSLYLSAAAGSPGEAEPPPDWRQRLVFTLAVQGPQGALLSRSEAFTFDASDPTFGFTSFASRAQLLDPAAGLLHADGSLLVRATCLPLAPELPRARRGPARLDTL